MEATAKKRPRAPSKGGGLAPVKSGEVKLPVQTTLEPGALWDAGVRQLLPDSVRGQVEEMKNRADRYVLPTRERQNAATLTTTPGLRKRVTTALLEEEPQVHPLMAMLCHNNSWHRASVSDTLRAVAAPELAADLSALHTKSDARFRQNGPVLAPGIRFVDSELGGFAVNTTNKITAFEERGHRGDTEQELPRKAAERAKALYDRDRSVREVAFFADDPLETQTPEDEPYGMAPHKYAMFNHLKANIGHRYEQRHDTLRDLGENVPRRIVEEITLSRLDELRYPVHGPWRGCCYGPQCIVQILARSRARPDFGYTEREYKSKVDEIAYLRRRAEGIPVSVEADGPVGPCVDDLLFSWQNNVYQIKYSKRVPSECMNIFSLEDGAYSRDYLHDSSPSSGIEGNVPQFLSSTRQFVKRKLPDGREVNYLEDTNSVFRPSLSEANTCLGAPKARPFAGPFRFAATPVTVFLPRFHLERAAGPAAAWIAFLRDCHPAVLADRATLARAEDGGVSGSTDSEHSSTPLLPVVWLRRAIDLISFRDNCGELTPQATLMTRRIFETSEQPISEARAGAILHRWMDMALCSFERSVSLWLHEARQGNFSLAIAPIALLLGTKCYARLTRVFWSKVVDQGRGIHVPRVVQVALDHAPRDTNKTWQRLADAILGNSGDETHVFWAVALFRCACAAYFNTAFYRRDPLLSEEFDRNAHYFMETHVHLLAHMLRAPTTSSDRHLFEAAPASSSTPTTSSVPTRRPRAPWLALLYPSAHRVLCAEEMPDLAPALIYANPWYDMGNRKTQSALFPMLVLLFLLKVINSTCQRRGYVDILERDIRAFPVLGRFLRLIVYCVLAGNLPHALHRLPLAARARLATSFAPFANAETDESFIKWMRSKCMVMWFLVREYYFFHVANAWVLERLFADSRKWPRFKTIVRITNGEVRREIAAQVGNLKEGDPSGVYWEDLERVVVSGRDQKGREKVTKKGLIMTRHDCTLKQFNKLRKGRFEELFKSKTKGIEKSLALDYAAADAWLNSDGRLEACHLVAWYLAQRSHAEGTSLKRQLVIETRWLKVLGMSEAGLRELRRWMFEYYEWDTGDESLKAKGRWLFNWDWKDYVITRVTFRLTELYRDQVVVILPLAQTLRQVNALRAALNIEPYFASPPHLGRLLFCEGCHNWVSDVCCLDPVLFGDLRSTLKAHDTLSKRLQTEAQERAAVLYGDRAASLPSSKRAAQAAAATLAFGSNATGAGVCSFRRVYMDPLDGQLYCTRGTFGAPLSNEAPVWLDEEDVDPAAAEEDEEEDPFDTLALGRMKGKQWLRKHGENAVACATAPAPKGKTIAEVGDVALHALKKYSCSQPLTEICLLGTYFRLHNRFYGICVHCGHPCEVLSCNKTGLGLSCGKHPLADAYPDNHKLWLSLGVTRAETLQAFANPVPRHPCFACRSATAAHYLEAYDFKHRLFRVPLCQHHFLCCSSLVPIAPRSTGQGSAVVVPPPLRIDVIMERVWAKQ